MTSKRPPWRILWGCAACLLLTGCAALFSNTADNLSSAILNHDDPGTVRDGAPAYLLLIDSFIQGSPDNAELLRTGADLYAAYTAVFIADDKERARRLAARSYEYATRAICTRRDQGCNIVSRPFDSFAESVTQFNKPSDVPYLYVLAQSWLIWIQAHSEDWGAVADLPKTEILLTHIIDLDETYRDGGAHTFLGMLATLRPPALGGKPEVGRRHFERAIELSGGRNLSAKVQFAESYARLVFDRELHDTLLREVLAAETEAPGQTLLNIFAKQRAQNLLDSADAYF
ncbi:MAG: TRAP transporter TatT component family protein [Gammaproteobacteria bacterium]|nr:TRAP transporter TatT component family protein [Gammaproteobacteria bacterium]